MAVQRPTEIHAPFHSDSSAEIEEEGEEEEEEEEEEKEEAVVMDSPPDDDHCSICHDDFALPCQANCSHWFCGSCILRVWHHGSALQPCKCPICRRLITLIVPSQISRQENIGAETGQVMASIAHYNQLFGGGPRSLTQKLWDLPFFLRRMARDFTDPHRTLPFLFRARIVFAMDPGPIDPSVLHLQERHRSRRVWAGDLVLTAIYILSPIDIVPEGIFGIVGLLDDFLVLMVVFLHLAAIYRSILLYRHGAS